MVPTPKSEATQKVMSPDVGVGLGVEGMSSLVHELSIIRLNASNKLITNLLSFFIISVFIVPTHKLFGAAFICMKHLNNSSRLNVYIKCIIILL